MSKTNKAFTQDVRESHGVMIYSIVIYHRSRQTCENSFKRMRNGNLVGITLGWERPRERFFLLQSFLTFRVELFFQVIITIHSIRPTKIGSKSTQTASPYRSLEQGIAPII